MWGAPTIFKAAEPSLAAMRQRCGSAPQSARQTSDLRRGPARGCAALPSQTMRDRQREPRADSLTRNVSALGSRVLKRCRKVGLAGGLRMVLAVSAAMTFIEAF